MRTAILAWSFRNRSTRISAGNNKITQQVQILLCLLYNIYEKNAPMENHPNFGVIFNELAALLLYLLGSFDIYGLLGNMRQPAIYTPLAAVFCSVLQCVAVCCRVLQCVAVCCSVLLQ